MNLQTGIEWTDMTWNPVYGCTKMSAGCKNCYAEDIAKKNEDKWGKFSEVKVREYRLDDPEKIREPKLIFVNSMSDLFHENVPSDFIFRVFEVMRKNSHHTFQILTKRPERLLNLDKSLYWTSNIWMGVSIENRAVYDRIDLLRESSAKIKWLSIEPLLESVADINLEGIDWVVVGGESGKNARTMKPEWVQEVFKACREQKVPFFFKQWGGKSKWESGRILNGKTYNEFPEGYLRLKASMAQSYCPSSY
ncbi:DUF5131 family protein [Leptospira interrogans]|uniref:DUF5131 family protein n=1 Tax=Leptospira interrogans TaxID=173 RepID=UPI0002B97B01|nr:DUF5131 family protein [Leptospira interrogans]MCR8649127.1 hypothetical protein [Leptospira interrogans serovar Bataviae]OAM86102.1 hypothetical protein A1343_15830 [Leptospira interrogans serovar Bataviae]QOI40460.1 phage Gp37/Gp68 family protein [Leptospira interrogans serovar Bataviae]